MTLTFVRSCELPVSAEEAFAWHARDGAFERLLPPWEGGRLIRRSGGIRDGAETEILVRIGPIPVRWRAVHFGFEKDRQFCDRQMSGPFAFWEHHHAFHPGGASSCTLEDRIEYQPPLGAIGAYFGRGTVEDKLQRMFNYRHAVTRSDLADHAQYRDHRRLRIAMTGASGLIGTALTAFLTTGGHQVVHLKRSTARQPTPSDSPSKAPADNSVSAGRWDTQTGEITLPEHSQPLDAVVHLAGEGIAAGRWTAAVKQRIHDSRVQVTQRLAAALARQSTPPRVFLSASAIGYYGDCGSELLDEDSKPGNGFLAEVCRDWEVAAEPLQKAGIRVAHARFGMILSPLGGALSKVLTPFRFGAGGPIGKGGQIWSWIALDDVLSAIHYILMNDQLSGPFNFTTPQPVSSDQFAKTLGRVLHRPAVMPLPAFAARLALGEMADELLLASANVAPRRLIESNYRFRFPELELALRHLLGR
jgi:uncharacterized protein (TIGR01777 family)